MNEKPVLFSAEMVRAILEGRKTQTRRVIRDIDKWDRAYLNDSRRVGKPVGEVEFFYYPSCGGGKIEPPYGRSGDSLWVRETWGTEIQYGGVRPSRLPSDIKIFYRTDGEGQRGLDRWRPSIFMPRWASRITLMVTNVRVERVQDISEDDAIAEGIQRFDYGPDSYKPEYRTICFGTQELALGAMHTTAKGAFSRLWDSINSKSGYSWASNPWVWVVEFEIVSQGGMYTEDKK